MSTLLVVAVIAWLGGGFLAGAFGIGADGGFFLGLGVGWAVVLVVAVAAATGPIYFPPKAGEKALRRWGVANQIVAWIMVVLIVAHFLSRLV